MRKIIRKATEYAKRNPEKTKRYAKKAYDTVQRYRKKSKSNPRPKP
ncbi:hypothetical protein [Halobacillus sp. BBL2006]|nr:hypothetical protein [Halobacillus sp. BBL2006]